MSGVCSHVTIKGARYTSYTYTKSANTQAIATRSVRKRPYGKINRQRKLQLDAISFLGYICQQSDCAACWWELISGVFRLGGETDNHTTHVPGHKEN